MAYSKGKGGLGEKGGKKEAGCTLKGMKSHIPAFGDKSMKMQGKKVSSVARNKVGESNNIMSGRVDA
jgi:hypothetical protein